MSPVFENTLYCYNVKIAPKISPLQEVKSCSVWSLELIIRGLSSFDSWNFAIILLGGLGERSFDLTRNQFPHLKNAFKKMPWLVALSWEKIKRWSLIFLPALKFYYSIIHFIPSPFPFNVLGHRLVITQNWGDLLANKNLKQKNLFLIHCKINSFMEPDKNC